MSFTVRREQILGMRRDQYVEQLSSVFRANGGRISSDPSNGDLLLADPAGRITRVALGTNGLPHSTTTPEGRTFRSEIGDDGQLRGITNPAGYHVGLDYAPDGRISALSAGGREVWRLRYEESGRLADIGYADSTTTRLRYGPEGLAVTNRLGHSEILGFEESRLISAVDGNGNKTGFEYSAWDRPDRAILADGSVEVYAYDEKGHVTSIQWGTSASVELQSNPAGQPLHLHYGDGQILRFSYDDQGNPIAAVSGDLEVRFRWSQAGRLVEEYQEGSSVRYAHDPAGNLASLTYPGGSVVRFEYDNDGRVVSVWDWAGRRHTYKYIPENSGYVQNSPSGLATIVAMSPSGLPTTIRVLDGAGRRLFATALTYDDNLRAVSIDDSEFGIRQFTYDAEGQLLSVRSADGSKHERFAYDAAGNRIESNGEPASFNALNQLLTQGRLVSTYDRRGNAIGCAARGGQWAFRWDHRNLLVAADGPAGERLTFGYDAFARRIWKRQEAHGGRPKTTTRFFWSGEQLITIIIERGLNVKRQDFLYLPGTFVPVATRIDGRIYTYHCDHRGAPTRLTDEQGKVVWAATYGPFGEAAFNQSDVENPLRLPGQWEDSETGLCYNRFRYYSPMLGRYLSRDPLSFVAGPNLYTYVGNDPINRTDPLGLWWKAALSVVAGVAAAAIVVVTAPVSLPLLAVGAGAAVMGVGVGLGVNKMLNLKEPNLAELGKAFLSGLVSGAVIAGAVVGAMVALPAAASAIAVGAAGVGIYAMCQEHFGWHLMPWEKKSVPFSEMTPEQQNRSAGGLWGGLAGAAAVGVVASKVAALRASPQRLANLDALYGEARDPQSPVYEDGIKPFEKGGDGKPLKNPTLQTTKGGKKIKLDPNKEYIWVVDEEGDLLVGEEVKVGDEPSGKAQKLGHPTLTEGGKGRVGGELRYDTATGKWNANNASGRYSAGRSQNEFGNAVDLMQNSGIDVGSTQFRK